VLDDPEDAALLSEDKDTTRVSHIVSAISLVDIETLDRAAGERDCHRAASYREECDIEEKAKDLQYVRFKYACRHCDRTVINAPVVIARIPTQRKREADDVQLW
jgi:hypothetical protein